MKTEISNDELNAIVRKHKTSLARAKASGDPQKIIQACKEALAEFEETSYPDNWNLWQREMEDAQMEAVCHSPLWPFD